MSPVHRILGSALLWGASWSLGLIVTLGPTLPAGVDPLSVLWVGGMGFMIGGALNAGLTYACRNKDLTEIGVGGLGLFREEAAVGVAHVLGTTWIAFRLALTQDGGSFFFGFPGRGDLVALSAALFTLPIWALVASVIRMGTSVNRHVVFFLADLVAGATIFRLFLVASRGIG